MDLVFPPIERAAPATEFSTFNFWKEQHVEVAPEDLPGQDNNKKKKKESGKDEKKKEERAKKK